MNPESRILVDRDRFRLALYRWNHERERFRRVVTYKIATGAVGRATPPGPYVVLGKSREPDWRNPATGEDHPWGTPGNPFEGGFIALGGHPSTDGDGVGIHGTKFPPMIGTRASHGCIRMRTIDLLDIYDRVQVGQAVDII